MVRHKYPWRQQVWLTGYMDPTQASAITPAWTCRGGTGYQYECHSDEEGYLSCRKGPILISRPCEHKCTLKLVNTMA